MHSVDSHGYNLISASKITKTNNGTKHVDLRMLADGNLSITQCASNFIPP